jgi:hypothetical protein
VVVADAPADADVPWLSAERNRWWDEIVAWVTSSIVDAPGGDLGPVLEIVSFRERPWSALLAVEVPAGRLYGKAIESARGFEVAVTAALSSVAPRLVPTVVALDRDRRWLLLGDHGAPIAEALGAEERVDAIRSLLPAYAAMQVATVDRVEAWLAAGVPDRRVSQLPAQLSAFLSGLHRRDLAHECEPMLPAFRHACDELSAGVGAAVPADALDHADIHGTNVVFDGHEARLLDWGDACITHPFASLFVPSHLVLPALPVSRRAAAERSLRDAYLGPWGGPTAANLRLVALAMWVAPIVRVLSLAEEADGGDEIVELLSGWAAASPVAD